MTKLNLPLIVCSRKFVSLTQFAQWACLGKLSKLTNFWLLVYVNKFPSKSRMVLVLFTTVILISRQNSNFLILKLTSTIQQFNGKLFPNTCNFCSTGPIFKIFTFLEMALKFVCSSSSAGGRGMKIEAATVIKKNSVK